MKNQKTISKKQKLPFKREFSAGGVVYKKIRSQSSELRIQWLIGKHSGYHRWVLPKGLIERGERGYETAVRETEEEMGVKARVMGDKLVHKEQYWFVAELGKSEEGEKKKPIRRVETYQEEPGFEESGKRKMRIFKTVSFYLMEYVSGDPKDHDWEMSEAGWYEFEEALEKLDFAGERAALKLARDKIL